MGDPKFTAEELHKMPMDELEAMQNKLASFMEKRIQSKKKEALEEIKNIIKDHELSFDEVTKAIRTTAKRGKAVAMYRNPDNPRQTWSGKGEAPDWYAAHPNPKSLKID